MLDAGLCLESVSRFLVIVCETRDLTVSALYHSIKAVGSNTSHAVSSNVIYFLCCCPSPTAAVFFEVALMKT